MKTIEIKAFGATYMMSERSYELTCEGARLAAERASEREAAPFVRDPESWQAVAAAGRKYA